MKEISKVIARRMKDYKINYSKRRKRGKLSYRMFHYASSNITITSMEDGSKKIRLDNESYMIDNGK